MTVYKKPLFLNGTASLLAKAPVASADVNTDEHSEISITSPVKVYTPTSDDENELKKFIGESTRTAKHAKPSGKYEFKADDNSGFYATTINIQPDMLFNKKKFKYWDHAKQIGLITRIEYGFRRKHLEHMHMIEMTFEECPVLKQMHAHILYFMEHDYIGDYKKYINKSCSINNNETRTPWRPICHKYIRDATTYGDCEGWIKYIYKDQNLL